MKILVTGTSGFVGSNLLLYLKGRCIDVISLTRSELNNGEFDKLHEVDVVVHLAGKAHDLQRHVNTQDYYLVNFELTKRLYSSYLNSNASKFILISSVKAAADSVVDILKESDPPAPKTHYGKSKLMAEQYIADQPLPISKSYYILRPCMIHGPGNKGNLNLLYKIISNGIPYPLAAFRNDRSFLSVENLCFVISELLERSDVSSGVYNVADNDTLSTNELIKLIAITSDKKPRLWHISPRIVGFLARVGDKLRLPLTSERLNKLTESYVVDNTKIIKALGKELPISAREGIIKTIESFSKK